MKVCLVYLLAALVVMSNVDRNSANPLTSTGKPTRTGTVKPSGVTENLFFFNKFGLRSTARPSASPAPAVAPLAVPRPASGLTIANGTRVGNATVFQDPTCAFNGDFGCLALCQNLAFRTGACDSLGFCTCL